MAIAEALQSVPIPSEVIQRQDDVDVRLDVHDASRLEWSVSIPLPERGQLRYAIDVELEIPANVFARHLPWDQLQSWTRLDGVADGARRGETPSIDTLRRGAMAFAHKVARASEGFARHCRLAGALSGGASHPTPFDRAPAPQDFEDELLLWIAFVVTASEEARERLAKGAPRDGTEIGCERELVDEYISVRVLETLASAERAVAALRESRNIRVQLYERALANVEARLAEALELEVAHRNERRWLHPDPHSPASLESYIERASRLKKHFQEVLFLEAETYQVAERLHNWVAAFVAIVASTWAFAWQIALMHRAPTTTSQVGSGIFVVAVIAGVVYAVKDRIKELGRTWISGNVHRFYAQRVACWRAPAKRMAGRDVVVRARESFDQSVVRRRDPLNPESGATLPATLVRYVHRGVMSARKELRASGVRRVKHVFRYDLSPLFTRLDDPVKQVPVLDGATRKVSFTAAPRCYRVPVRLCVRCGTAGREERATLVLDKRGLDRLEFEEGMETALEMAVLDG
jgi:hypothetical protein